MTQGNTATRPASNERRDRAPLHAIWLDTLAPFGATLADHPVWPDALRPSSPDQSLYALLDAAKTPFLAEFLTASDTAHRCLFSGKQQVALGDVAPWLIALDPAQRFTADLFTQSDAGHHFWDRAPGMILRSDASFDALWRWCRKLLWVRDGQGKRFFLRWWDPDCTDVTLPMLNSLDAELRTREFDVDLLVPSAWAQRR